MKVLFLGSTDSALIPMLHAHGEETIIREQKIDLATVHSIDPDFVISYGYRHIIRPEVIAALPKKIINLHISYLPWNRGADPNFWSIVEGTPKGVTIHYIDNGIDTGEILVQNHVEFCAEDTLKTSYDKLQTEIRRLFNENWPAIRDGKIQSRPQSGAGSFHLSADRNQLAHLTRELGFDTPISRLFNKIVK